MFLLLNLRLRDQARLTTCRREFLLAKRILYVITKAERGGAQSHLLELLRASRQRYTVQLATEEHGFLVDEAKAIGVSVIPLRHLVMPLNPAIDLQAIREISSAIRQFRPDLVHAHSSKAGLLSRIAARVNRVPSVFTAHGWGFSPGVPARRRYVVLASEWLAGKLRGTTIAVSEYDRRLALRAHITSSDRIVTILNGIPDDGIRASPEQQTASPVITMVARFSAQKDHAALLQALRTVRLPFRLWLVGDGPLLEQVKEQATVFGLSDRVVFHGNSSAVPELLRQTHIFTLISRYEGLPISILEAMRAGLPVVATDTGGVSEAVRNELNGFLVSQGDVSAVKSSLEQLLENRQLRATYGKNSRTRYENGFMPEPMFARTFEVYEKLLSPGPPPS